MSVAGAGPPLPGAEKDEQSITADWVVLQEPIEGVRLIEVSNVLRDTGLVTEILRSDWFDSPPEVDQIFQLTLEPGALTAWHVHMHTTDRLFVSTGQAKIVLYDGRPGSPTHGRINEFRLGERRPGLLVVPAGVWHGVKNLGSAPGTVVNIVDFAYRYEDPDHWRLPPDSPEIPYSW
jgi:dTDP-4-dehydrorhamnose 3,5-epimerase